MVMSYHESGSAVDFRPEIHSPYALVGLAWLESLVKKA